MFSVDQIKGMLAEKLQGHGVDEADIDKVMDLAGHVKANNLEEALRHLIQLVQDNKDDFMNHAKVKEVLENIKSGNMGGDLLKGLTGFLNK